MEVNMNIRVIELLNDIKALVQGKSTNRWMDIKETSQHTAVSSSTIRRAVKRGELQASHRTGKLLFRIADVERWLNE
jgi:excisionase family DNA binding protein|tara:strand:- start:3418 stop:3648 length:231 start_codon:yes stop_codon:yes gene_type:complete